MIFYELPQSIVWCLSLILEISQTYFIISFSIFFFFLLGFQLFRPKLFQSSWMFWVGFYPPFFLHFNLKVSSGLSWSSLIFSLAMSKFPWVTNFFLGVLINQTRTFFISIRDFHVCNFLLTFFLRNFPLWLHYPSFLECLLFSLEHLIC